MNAQRWLALPVLLAAWAALAVWQYREYQSEVEMAQQLLHRQAETLDRAIVGGIRSHRRMGQFFQEQLQGSLEELVRAEDVLAVAVAEVAAGGQTPRSDPDPASNAENDDDAVTLRLLVGAGRVTSLFGEGDPERSAGGLSGGQVIRCPAGSEWTGAGFRHVRRFRLSSRAMPEHPSEPPGPGPGRGGGWGGGRGMGPGMGPGGRGFGPGGMRGRGLEDDADDSDFSAGGTFATVLLLNTQQTETQIRRAAWLRSLVAIAGGVILAGLAAGWLILLRLNTAQNRARLLAAETRHLRELNQAAAGLAHETRNPLGLIRGWTQRLAKESASSPEAKHNAEAVIEECDRVTARINQFLAFAREPQPSPETVDLQGLVEELRGLLAPDLTEKRLQLDFDSGGERAGLRADREMLREGLFNLLQNAVGFAPEGSTITVRIARGDGGTRRIEVSDRGPGVAPENVESLFSPYFTTRPGGTGLGLALVRRIALAHGWQTGYQPRPGGGSTFYLDHISTQPSQPAR